MSFEDRINFIRDNDYHDILYMYCDIVINNDFDREKEFSHLMYYIQDVCYLPCIYEPLVETYSNKKFLTVSFPEYEGPRFEHYGAVSEHVGREYNSVEEMVTNTLEDAGYL